MHERRILCFPRMSAIQQQLIAQWHLDKLRFRLDTSLIMERPSAGCNTDLAGALRASVLGRNGNAVPNGVLHRLLKLIANLTSPDFEGAFNLFRKRRRTWEFNGVSDIEDKHDWTHRLKNDQGARARFDLAFEFIHPASR